MSILRFVPYYIGSTTDPERYVFLTDEQLAACKDAVVKREPEIAECPNPECGAIPNWIGVWSWSDGLFSVRCIKCGYHSPEADTEQEAIRLHNNLAGRE